METTWSALGVLAAVPVAVLLIWLAVRGARTVFQSVADRAERRESDRHEAARRRVVGQLATQQIPAITDQVIAAFETPGGAGWTPDPVRLAGHQPPSAASSAPILPPGRSAATGDARPESDRAAGTGRHHLSPGSRRRPPSVPASLALPFPPADARHTGRRAG